MEILINVNYTNGTGVNGKGNFWAESYLKNAIITVNEKQTIHQAIVKALEGGDCCEVSYKGKPQGNIYKDLKNGETVICGYLYRVKHFISDRSEGIECYAVFDAWVGVKKIASDFELESVEE